MADRIKGVIVQLGGDASGLSKALSDVNKEINSTQRQLKDVEKLLKLDPTNTELLQQKQRLLAQAVEETKTKLGALKDAENQAQQQFAEGKISQEQYEALQREIVETEQKLKNLEKQAATSNAALGKIAAVGEEFKKAGDKISGVGEKMLPATCAVAGLGTMAVKTASDFDAAMSKVAAVSGATGEDFDALREKAREMGAKTKFSASEAAEAMNYMAMAGWKTTDMLSGIEGIMNLAAASGEDLVTTSDIVTDALTAFGLTAKDSGHFADILAAASSNANTNVSMMGETFKYAAPIAGALGYSAEDTAEAIGLMANAGIKSSQAGTALRTIMTKLSGEIEIYGDNIGDVIIATTNADGSMRDFSDILADCRKAFSGLTESEQAATAEALVGKTALSGFLALMNASPADIEKLSGAIDTCNGTSEKMAAVMQDNLSGQLTILKSQLEELAISFGDILMPVIRKIVTAAQNLTDKLNNMDEGTRNIIIAVGLAAAALAPILIIVGKVISAVGSIMMMAPQIAAAITTVKTAVTALSAGLAGNPITIVIAGISALVAALLYLWNNCEGFRDAVLSVIDTVRTAVSNIVTTVAGWFTNLGQTLASIWSTIRETASTIWTTLSTVVTTIVQTLVTTLTTAWDTFKASITAIVQGIFTTLKGIWELLKNTVLGIVLILIDILTGNWEKLKSDLSNITQNLSAAVKQIWDGIKTYLSGVVQFILTAITTAWENIKTAVWNKLIEIKTAVTDKWNEILTWLRELPAKLRTIGTDMFNRMKEGIASVIDNVYTTVTEGINKAINWIKALPGQALQWGKDFLQGFIDGVGSMIEALVNKVKGIGDSIRGLLHFSRPDWGPLRDYETWMPDFMRGLAKGIDANAWRVQDAVESLASGMVVSPVLASSPAGGHISTQTTTNQTTNLGGVSVSVYAAPGQSVDQVADAVAVKLQNLTLRRERVRA